MTEEKTMSISIRLAGVRKFLGSPLFMALNVIVGSAFLAGRAYVYGAIFFLMEISVLLAVSDDILPTILPFLQLCVTVLPCYNSFDTFIKYVYLAPVPIAALAFHFIAYKKPIKVGSTFYGIVAVAVAVTTGGAGAISTEEYTSLSSLFYMFTLGIGMCGAYLLLKSQLVKREDYDVRDRLAETMIYAGIYASIQTVLLIWFAYKSGIAPDGEFADWLWDIRIGAGMFQANNNLATILMMCLPFCFYRLRQKKYVYAVPLAIMALCLYTGKSRAGMYLGIIEIVVLTAVYLMTSENSKVRKGVFIISVIGFVLALKFVLDLLLSGKLVSPTEARALLLVRSFDDFWSNPLFGQGIGSRKNTDIYDGVAGTMIWYHMMLPQIYGSMGLVGIAAYAFQAYGRIKLTVKKFSLYTLTLAMSYFGLLLMSQINPGEFCPFPYGIMAVIMFIMMENEPDSEWNITDFGWRQ